MRLLPVFVLAASLLAQEKKEGEEVQPVDVGKVLRESKDFQASLAKFKMSYKDGEVRAVGEIAYRGGGPCEYLVNVFPAKSHETIVLLDNGPWDGEGRRRRDFARGLATTLNNAFLAAGFEKGKPFDWDRETGEVFPPKGEVVHIYAEWKDDEGKLHRARMTDWLWNYKEIEVMAPGSLVYTGSMMIDEGPPDHKMWFGAEVDGLLVAILNTSTALMDNTEEAALENGAYEAIAQRVPEIGTRVTVVFAKKPLEVTEKYKPLELPKELQEEKARRAKEKAEAAKKKDEEKKD